MGSLQRIRIVARDRHHRNAQLGTFSPGLEIVQHQFGAIDGHGEPDADIAAVRPQDRGVDADHIAGRIEQRTAAVARIDGRVGLDQAFQRPFVFAANAAPERTDDAGGQRALQTEGIADGEHLLAHLQRVGIAQVERGQLGARRDLQQRQVVGFVAAQQLRLVAGLIGQRHFELALIGDHVVVGEDLAVRADQEARALILGRINFHEDGAAIDGAGDVHRGEMRRLVDVDIVHLIRTQAGGVRGRRAGPKRRSTGDWIQNPALSPIGLGGDEKKSAHQQSGDDKDAR